MSDQDNNAIEKAFERGVAAAMDPANAADLQETGHAVTNARSPWLHTICPCCKHSFRLEDEVDVAPDGTVCHGGESSCRDGQLSPAEEASRAAVFFAALDAACPPPTDVRVTRLEGDHPLLDQPTPQFPQRKTCFTCGHTFRPHDVVVICPCFPDSPRCSAAMHLDAAQGLQCYKDWNPGGGPISHCPITSWKINE